jgi:hypothetical protein
LSFHFRSAGTITEQHGCFVALVGGTNSGKTFSALRLARGIAGPKGKIAVADTEGGRTLHLKQHFDFDVTMMDAPHRPARYRELAKAAEDAKYDVLVIDSFSSQWAGIGGVLDWREEEAQRMAGGDERKLERVRGAAWIKPKTEHKLMVQSFLGRRIPIIFSIRGEESFKPPSEKFFKAICSQSFLFEVTVSFRLAQDRKGVIDLSDAKTFKMEGDHRSIFHDGEQLAEAHGEKLIAWARGGAGRAVPPPALAPAVKVSPAEGPPVAIAVTERDGALDWTVWAQAAGAAIRSAPDRAWLAKWCEINRLPLDNFKRASPKNHERMRALIEQRNAEFDDSAGGGPPTSPSPDGG